MTKPLNAGLRSHLLRARKARRAARLGIDRVTAGLNTAQRMAVANAYHEYLAGKARGVPQGFAADYAPTLPAAVEAGPAVDWGLCDAVADYS